MSDNNLVSLAGKPDGELWLVDLRKPETEARTLLRPAGDTKWIEVYLLDIIPTSTTTDSLKISGAINLSVRANTVRGGLEDVIDINHSQNVNVSILRAEPLGKYVATIKGSQGIILSINNQIGHGSEVDFDLGNWSDQSRAKTTNVSLSSLMPDWETSTYRTFNADNPMLIGGRWKKLQSWPPWLFLFVMTILKKLHLA